MQYKLRNDDTAEISLILSTMEGPKLLVACVGETLLDVARRNNLNVDGTCAGDLNCSTCHCIIGDKNVFKKLNPKTSQERDLLQSAWGVRSKSRLSCQVVVTPEMDKMRISFPSIFQQDMTPIRYARQLATRKPTEFIKPKKFKSITKSAIPRIFAQYAKNNASLIDYVDDYTTIANILPFRCNNYVIEELIDWNNVPNDPMFQLTFPQPGMLKDREGVENVRRMGKSAKKVREAADIVRAKLNPHPAKQREMNVPNHQSDEGKVIYENGMQHKYRETVLFFPSESQYCHSYCTYCFRWAQFVGSPDMHFASNQVDKLVSYLSVNKGISDILFTGGDPMVLNSKQLGKYLDTIATSSELEHISTIRIGSKSLAYWPYKYVTDDDADNMLRLLERVVSSGKHISLMAHFTHPVELSTPVVREAIRRLQNTGIQIRCQAPLTNRINNDPYIWAEMWKKQTELGMIPYYMFIERDTGAKNWFQVPLARALHVYNKAIQQVSGLARTARGPSMSCTPGKVVVLGVENIKNEKVFVLKMIQGRNPSWTERIFFAKFDEKASWLDDLEPAFGEENFFFEKELDLMEKSSLNGSGSSGQLFQSNSFLKPS